MRSAVNQGGVDGVVDVVRIQERSSELTTLWCLDVSSTHVRLLLEVRPSIHGIHALHAHGRFFFFRDRWARSISTQRVRASFFFSALL